MHIRMSRGVPRSELNAALEDSGPFPVLGPPLGYNVRESLEFPPLYCLAVYACTGMSLAGVDCGA